MVKLLVSYKEIPKGELEQRRVAVSIFRFETPQQSIVSLERQVNLKHVDIPAATWSGVLNNEVFWIYQERADALLPSYHNEWILKAGNHGWKFHFME
jgi:hypothetical protein